MNIAIIPARIGSKRIPQKNILAFAGKPMLAHAIDAAHKSGLFEHIVVSTESPEIAAIARAWGAETPFTRPAELADDYASTTAVIAQAISACETLGWRMDYICCIYPCTPFLETDDLISALNLLESSQTPYAFPVCEYPSPVQRALRRLPDGHMEPLYPEFEQFRTQDLETAYHDAGQFYWGTADAWLTNNSIHGSGVGLPIPHWRVVDIDTPDDWRRAELLYTALNQ